VPLSVVDNKGINGHAMKAINAVWYQVDPVGNITLNLMIG
jgi:hypothetical protein